MTLLRRTASMALVIMLLVTAPVLAASGDSRANGEQTSFYDRIMAILKDPSKLDPPGPPPAVPERKGHTPIFGTAEIPKNQMIAFIKRHNPIPKLTCSLEELVDIYYEEAAHEGVRPDLALAQAILETGFFRYGGDVAPAQNNFAGIGSVGGGAKGAWFETPRVGARAHVQHLLAYATHREPLKPVVDPRYGIVRSMPQYFAKCYSWESLSGKWAIPGVGYGEKIVRIVEYIKASTVPAGG